jgi:hypothetical protein
MPVWVVLEQGRQGLKDEAVLPPWLRSALIFGASVLAPALMLAAIAAVMWAFGWTPKAKQLR